MTFPQSAQEALEQLKAIPTIKQDYSEFRLTRCFHWNPLELEGYSVTEKQWVTLWHPDILEYQESTSGY